ncbi:hypothetical protein VST7929_01802 [Vibrio stylophorae]|uniref:Uncharacterized protein n=1 Tax=Vibrio stylophorae TaxID=659351 RepID=A0ABN8DVI1_9VIBR|nr:hypothetical protein [Vibrio stylophorae]CAH0533925.1 hypothetical protein VST7929_01802 [Vibrio stylophorae]
MIVRNMLIRGIAVLLMLGFTYMGADYSHSLDPAYFQWPIIVFYALIGALLQFGLFVSSTEIGCKFRWLTFLAMSPCMILLGLMSLDVLKQPLLVDGFEMVLYPVTLMVYCYAAWSLWQRTHLQLSR